MLAFHKPVNPAMGTLLTINWLVLCQEKHELNNQIERYLLPADLIMFAKLF